MLTVNRKIIIDDHDIHIDHVRLGIRKIQILNKNKNLYKHINDA